MAATTTRVVDEVPLSPRQASSGGEEEEMGKLAAPPGETISISSSNSNITGSNRNSLPKQQQQQQQQQQQDGHAGPHHHTTTATTDANGDVDDGDDGGDVGHEGILLKKLLFSKEFSDVRFEFPSNNDHDAPAPLGKKKQNNNNNKKTRILYANKQILAAACPDYFNKKAFANAASRGGGKEGGGGGGVIVFRPDASYEVVKAVLSFVYTGDLALTKRLLLKDTRYHLETIKIANLYQLPRLKEIVAKLMKHSLSPQTLKGCLIASHQYDLPNLKTACFEMIHNQGMSVLFGQPAFLAQDLPTEYPELWMELAHSIQEFMGGGSSSLSNKHNNNNNKNNDTGASAGVVASRNKRQRRSY